MRATYDYEVGNAHYRWLEQTIDGARAAGMEWVIVGMHKVCITAGDFGYLAAWHGANSPDPGRGYLHVTVSSDRLDVEFVGTCTSYRDHVSIR